MISEIVTDNVRTAGITHEIVEFNEYLLSRYENKIYKL
jgi:hypothetical protein